MANIQDYSTVNQLTIDSTSKAARITYYRPDGTLPAPVYAGSYVVSFNIAPSTLTAGTVYFAMQNLDTIKSAYIERIALNFSFTGTNAASVSLYEFVRFWQATPTGGTSLSSAKLSNLYGTSIVSSIQNLATGLTTTGVTFDYQQTATVMHITGHMNNLVMDRCELLEMTGGMDGEMGKWVLPPGWGLMMRANTVIVTGSSIAGSIWWDER